MKSVPSLFDNYDRLEACQIVKSVITRESAKESRKRKLITQSQNSDVFVTALLILRYSIQLFHYYESDLTLVIKDNDL